MYDLRKTKNRDASMRSRSNSPMNVDDPKPKIIPKLEWGDLTSDHESESSNYSQSDIQKSYKNEEENKLEFSDESSSEFSDSDIHWKRETIVALMFNQIKILITSKNSEMFQTLMKKKLEAC